MLPRAAARIAYGRPGLYAVRPSHHLRLVRMYAQDSSRGPRPNRTWGPERKTDFTQTQSARAVPGTARGTPADQGDGVLSAAEVAENADPRVTPDELAKSGTARELLRDHTKPGSIPNIKMSGQSNADSPREESSPKNQKDSNTSQPGIGSLPDLRYGIPSEPSEPFGQASNDDPTASSSSKPLPDLRQGIPSEYNIDPSDTSSSFKTKDADPPSLDLTEDPTRGSGPRRPDGMPRDAFTTSIERRRLRMARYMYMALFGAIVSGLVYSGRNWDTEEEEQQHPEEPSGWGVMAFYNRIKARVSSQMGFYTEPAFPKLLPVVDAAYSRPYTLVLSLEDLLVHNEWTRTHGWRLAKRPGVDYFLRYLSQYYELVIFTTVPSMMADPIIRKLDPYQVVMWPLFREATRYMNGEHVKDLSYLNRDLSKVVIIDTVPEHVKLQPENAIVLPKWKGDPKAANKTDLVALIPFLEYMAAMSIGDVRQMLTSYNGKDIPSEYAAREAKAREAFQKQMAQQKSKKRWGGITSSFQLGHGNLMLPPGEQTFEEGMAEGKMPIDVVRERGRRQYELLEKEIRENGAKWLEEMAREQKKLEAESMKAMQSGMSGFTGKLFGGIVGNPDAAAEGQGEKGSSA